MKVIENIDWQLLMKQKIALLDLLYYLKTPTEVSDELEGLIELIDAIQDTAVDELGIDEDLVFKYEE